ncbi:MAG: Spy/CpxP family protein refolding chaperone [Thalassobaculum sp.]|uniref:Spy/CpxP family protein refolding chaperone n=1 Tax=Thalassobaculum sp. TaxID=2022740 RepID=UPI0032EDF2CC
MRTSIYALVAAATLATATAAYAQQSPQSMPGWQMYGPMHGQGMMMGPGMMGPGMMPTMGMMDPSQHIEGRIAFLETELRITEAQSPQWSAFADAMRANAKRMSEQWAGMMPGTMMGSGTMGSGTMGSGNMPMMRGTMGPGMMMSGQAGTAMSLPERLDWAEKHMTARLEMLRAMKGATTQLYGVLSDEQKGLADQLIHGPMGMM